MYKLIAFYNQNRKKIWQILGFLAFLIIIFVMGRTYMLKKVQEKNKVENVSNNKNTEEKIENTNEHVVVKKDDEITNSETLTRQDRIEQTISKFVQQIQDGDIESSYNMLTDDCKKVLYPSKEKFYKKYVQENMNYGDTWEIEKWLFDTYRVNIIPDLISTGEIGDKKNKLDYITVEKDGEEYKLNINGYIGRKELNSKKEIDDFNFNVNYKDVFMNYETYNITLKNEKENTVVLDDLMNPKSMYLLTKGEKKDYAYTNELSREELKVGVGESKILNIKFYSRYVSDKKISAMVFSSVRGLSTLVGETQTSIKVDL